MHTRILTLVWGSQCRLACGVPGPGHGSGPARSLERRPVQPWDCRRCRKASGGRKIRRYQRHAAGQVSRRRLVRQRRQSLVRGDWHGVDFYLTPDGKLVPVVKLQPAGRARADLRAARQPLLNGKLYLTTRHRGILVYDPATKS